MGTWPRLRRESPARHRGIPRLPQVFAASPRGFTPALLPGATGPVRRQGCCSTRRGAARVCRGPAPGRDRTPAVPFTRVSRRPRPGAGDRPARRARPPITGRAAGSHQHQAARVPRRSAPGPRPLLCGSARPRRPPRPSPRAGPPGPALPGSSLVSAPPELNS
ncbi:hypothetical protein NDU88_003833 [Pleurodeles waltl]|uniref:Uncharacterized protein n=1 Tax=Pleurodeles waltl TaxID=8319 RepID=A0AAV7PB04_PLEWA|nr:hypothetical protein NDU88_003833 [Pleurodeles waltl]